MSFSYTKSSSFTIVQARLLSSKVAADMHLCALYYGNPTEERIRVYTEELAQLLNGGYVDQYEFGYKRDEKRVVCWRYVVQGGAIRRWRRSRLPRSRTACGFLSVAPASTWMYRRSITAGRGRRSPWPGRS